MSFIFLALAVAIADLQLLHLLHESWLPFPPPPHLTFLRFFFFSENVDMSVRVVSFVKVRSRAWQPPLCQDERELIKASRFLAHPAAE